MTENGKAPQKSPLVTNVRWLLDELERWQDKIEIALHHAKHSHTFDDIVNMVLGRRVFLFSYPECFLVLEIISYPQFKTLHIFLAGGDMEALLSKHDEVARFGASLGCKYLSLAGRKGWAKVLEARGWDYLCTTMQIPIGETDEQRQRWEQHNYGGTAARN